MSSAEAVAEIFMKAFKSLKNSEQESVLSKMFEVRKIKKDLIDIAVAELRSKEKKRPFREYLSEQKQK